MEFQILKAEKGRTVKPAKHILMAMLLPLFLASCGPPERHIASFRINSPVFQDAEEAYLRGDYGKAKRLFSEYLLLAAETASEAKAKYWLAMSEMKLGNYDHAVELLDGIEKRHTSAQQWALVVKARADVLFSLDRFRKAAEVYRNLEAEYSPRVNMPEVLYKRGLSEIRSGDFHAGRQTLSRVRDIFPDSYFAGRANETLSQVEGHFFVQIGVFSKRESAETVSRKAMQKGYTAYIRVIHINNKRLYSVRAGRMETFTSAQAFARRLSTEGFDTVVKP